MNILIKSDKRRENEEKLLKSYGINPENATSEQKEYASEISRRTEEIRKEMEANRL